VLAGAAAVGVAGCSSDSVLSGLAVSRTPPGSVEYWDLFGGGDGVRMQEMLDGFRKEHPDIRLDHVTLQWGNPYYTKLSLATIGDLPPTVAVSHLTRMKTLVSSNLLQELKPQDLARFGMTPDKFNKRAWEAGLVDGKAYAIPLDTHPFVMFYNTEVTKKAGLLDAAGQLKSLDGEDAFIDAMQRAKKVTGAYGGVKQFFDGLPRDLDEAARVDGARFFRIYRQVIMPLTRPAVAAVAIFSFVAAWNNLLWPLLVLTNPRMMTIPVGLATVQGTYGIRYADTMASAILGAIPLIAVFLLFQRHIVEGIAGTGLKG
jgi:ABC-type glycerol-3-phosphate transport system substrate-binding protein